MNFVIMGEKFKQILNILNTVENEMRFEFYPEYMHVRSVDPASVALVDLKLNKELFVSYEIEEPREVGIDIRDLYDLISTAGKLSDIAISLGDKMGINFDGLNFERSFIDPSTIRQTPRMPELPLNVSMKLDLDIIKLSLKGANTNNKNSRENDISFITDNNNIVFASKNDTGTNSFKSDPIEIEGSYEKTNSMYSVEYLSFLNQLKGEIAFKYGTELPVVFEYENDGMEMWYMIAPKCSKD